MLVWVFDYQQRGPKFKLLGASVVYSVCSLEAVQPCPWKGAAKFCSLLWLFRRSALTVFVNLCNERVENYSCVSITEKKIQRSSLIAIFLFPVIPFWPWSFYFLFFFLQFFLDFLSFFVILLFLRVFDWITQGAT